MSKCHNSAWDYFWCFPH